MAKKTFQLLKWLFPVITQPVFRLQFIKAPPAIELAPEGAAYSMDVEIHGTVSHLPAGVI